MNPTWLKLTPELRAELALPDSRYEWKDEDEGYYLSLLDNDCITDGDTCEVARVEATYDDDDTLLVLWFGFNRHIPERTILRYTTKNVEEACRLIYALFLMGD